MNRLAKDNQRVALLASTTSQTITRIDTLLGAQDKFVRAAFNDASQVATGALDLVAALKDNPGKKIISLLIGAALGLIAAGFVGLDLFAAAGAALPGGEDFKVGVMITGLILGLGSNPTHQVVSVVTDAAKARRSAQLGEPAVEPDPTSAPTTPQSPAASPTLRAARFGGGVRAVLPLDQFTPVDTADQIDLPLDTPVHVDLADFPMAALGGGASLAPVRGDRLTIAGASAPGATGWFLMDVSGDTPAAPPEDRRSTTPRVQPSSVNLGRRN